MSELLDALYRGEDVSGLLAGNPALDVFEAAALGRTERLRELLDEDPGRANAFGADGFQPLGLACFFGHVEPARLLLERGADPNTLARNELCKLLLAHGAEPTLPQAGGFRAIDAARQNGDELIERLLLAHGAEG